MGDERPVAVGVPGDPVDHVAAEAGPRGHGAPLLHVGQGLRMVGALEDVLVAPPAPVGVDVVDELLAETGGAAGIGHEDDVARIREDLGVPAEAPAVLPRPLRPAVDEDEQWVLLRGVEVAGFTIHACTGFPAAPV